MLDADLKVLRHVRANPGTNLETTARAILPDYSTAYIKARIHAMIALGLIRAEITDPRGTPRYQLFAADDAPEAMV